ncbi:glycerophosphodiester phosphodiesterase [Alteromonas sp. ASW11-36]|uniref:Glycerophosphodiester phosphodiesterase n=1 Tax=Alteromonas arenosi TaxID=3055817 RepID=A0ABT7SZF5_9ALTE|nr:glycerophosphodiester phosphodiesterase [Alteromonas sp. ASW11-36]MDM7861581.1 glycerophosphodiester phosphodiesterase [Alteromonas sp. ASW11-36]
MQVFAHRGVSGEAPENTLAAIQLALKLPICGVEVDVFACEDEYILIHDRWLTRTAGLAKRLDQMSLAELLDTPVGEHNSETQYIPTLAQVLTLDWRNHLLNLELKSIPNMRHFCDYLVQHCKAANIAPTQLLISSFHHGYLDEIHQIAAHYTRGWLTASYLLNRAEQAARMGCQWFNIDADVVDLAIVSDAHKRGLKVAVYTVDESADLIWLQQIGVDAVFCNHPGKAQAYLDKRKA